MNTSTETLNQAQGHQGQEDCGCTVNKATTAAVSPANPPETTYFTIETKASGVKFLWVNVPGKVTLFKIAAVYELGTILDWLATDTTLKGLVIASPKAGDFIAGADIGEIDALQEGSAASVYELLGTAKSIFKKIHALNVPVVAAIDGPCKGAGMELALWCTNRITSDNPRVALALPEVRLGLMPGYGGAVLLPRLIDTSEALKMVTTGSDVGAMEAWRLGLVDEVTKSETLFARAEALALRQPAVKPPAGNKAASKGKSASPVEKAVGKLLNLKGKPGSFKDRLGKALRGYPVSATVGTVKALSRGYSAPATAAAATLKMLDMPLDKALEYESAVFANMTQGNESHNLVDLFLDRKRVKRLASGAEAYPVKCLGIIGSGIMGREIAFVSAASAEIEAVVLVDVSDDYLKAAMGHIKTLAEAQFGKSEEGQAATQACLAKISTATSYSALACCDAIIEAIPERIDLKLKCYAAIDQAMEEAGREAPYFIFSNTSALSLNSLAQGVKYKERFSGMHFFNPVSRMLGVELPGTEHTSQETVATSIALVGAMGKIALPCKDYPGFIVNAILGVELLVTAHLLSMGVSPEAIDKAMKAFGMPMGPVELMDYVGLDVVLSVAKTLGAAHGERLALPENDLISALVAAGELGRKTGMGFYKWQGEKVLKVAKPARGLVKSRVEKLTGGAKREAVFNPVLRQLAPTLGQYSMSTEAIQEILVGAIESEAVRVLAAGVVDEPFLLDLAFVISTGFTASLGGPLRHIDQRGSKTFFDLMSDIGHGSAANGQSWRKNFEPCQYLTELAERRGNIYPA
ncbi:MAG TPA: 3-hydroxyacyl-CoA dehydrogenase NAD-binding domain-containing protein [Candidatus Obscuribacter sp.]|nr:3-hydroxyacyl-CoA dehydrogenase NAD-binding domain-containing protein [Candidatus Obscuribacter sp.]HND66790.1 3-hydroxyacyl-CoA dehydrogenase NAD-binding domain-containing protein [Candidatus Obscuribacter sp.]